MTSARIAGRDRRAVRLGALALAPALAFAFVVKPYVRAYTETRAQLATQRELLSREVTLLADSAHYPKRLHGTERALLGEAPHLFSGTDPLAASATLANYVGARAMHSRVFIQQSETRSSEVVSDGVLALHVDIRAQGDLEGMLGFLRSIEDGPKLVHVQRLDLERVETARSPSGGESSGQMEVLTLAATIESYALTETADSTTRAVLANGEVQP